jgi:hypothetical protein
MDGDGFSRKVTKTTRGLRVPLGFAFIEDSAHLLQWDSPDGLGRSRSNRIAAMAWARQTKTACPCASRGIRSSFSGDVINLPKPAGGAAPHKRKHPLRIKRVSWKFYLFLFVEV